MRTWKLPLRPWKLALLALVVISAATAAVIYERSVRRLPVKGGNHKPGRAAALFVGVQKFSSEPAVDQVTHAVDDAVDLAYAFSMAEKDRLVPPERVVLALSGEPKKDASKARLEKLREAGATVTAATYDDVLAQLQRQVEVAGNNGLLILSFASHGFSHEGTPYILTSTSRFEHATSLSAMKVLDLAAETKNSLIFIDACRERLDAGSRSVTQASGRTPAPLLSPKSRHGGQVVFYAAAPGEYAYGDPVAGNGVFTKAVLEGLNCKADTKKGQVTVGTLAEYVEKAVLRWVKRNRNRDATRGIQAAIDHRAIDLPLANCLRPPEPASVTVNGDVLTVLDRNLQTLWVKTVPGLSTAPQLEDLDGDGIGEVVVADDRGQVHVFNARGDTNWTEPTDVPANYDHCDTGTMRVTLLRTGHLFSHKRGRQIVAVSQKEDGCSRLTVYDHDRTFLGSYWHPGKILDVRIDRPTARRSTRIIASAVNRDLAKAPVAVRAAVGTVFVLDPKKIFGEAPPRRGRLGKGSQLWYGYVPELIEGLEIRDRNNDALRDIHVRTTHGYVCLDFDGETIESKNVQFALLK